MTASVPGRRDSRAAVAYVLSLASGAAVWLGVAWTTGRREAWDSEIYWTAGYPILAAFAAVCGWLVPGRAWRWPLLAMLVQPVVMLVQDPAGGSMLPLGLILFGVLSLPLIPAAYLGAFVRRGLRRSTRT